MNIIRFCQTQFDIHLPSELLTKRIPINLKVYTKNSTLNIEIVQTCYAKWSSICSGYCEFNALFHVCRVELLLFFSFSFVVFLLVPVLFACAAILYGE